MKVVARTPTRIDLAGGTLDIYPLYVFEGGGLTVNAAISLYSTVWVESRDDGGFFMRSQDLGLTYSATSLGRLDPRAAGPLSLVVRAVQHYEPPCGLTIITENTTPAGSGLGSSSSLLIALSGALNRFRGTPLSREETIDFAANIEAQAINVPTGKQDYYAAMYGGIQAIHFGMLGNTSEALITSEAQIAELQARLILCYTGESRFSGTTNWAMMKRYIDGEGESVKRLREIKRTALAMRESLLRADWPRFAHLLHEEWENRKGLAEGVSSPHIEGIMRAAEEAGALASKICGAGGGGGMITYAEPNRRAAVEGALREAGAEILPYHFDLHGLSVQETV